ncbi:MAG: amidase family protein [Metamycoplasmataceae bacterium]
MEKLKTGNFEKAIIQLKKDHNNAVFHINEKINTNRGILENTVFTIKNNFAIKDNLVSGSSKILSNFKPIYNSTVFETLISNGANWVASVNCDELALGGTGTYSSEGIIKNPIDKNRMIGGSSSGSAATFSENISFAIGSDTGDSVRLPASYIGVVGFKPSYGAVSRWGLFPYASSLDTVAWFTHSIQDSLNLSKILFKKDEKDMTSLLVKIKDAKLKKPQKIAYFDCFDYIAPEIAKEYQNFINLTIKNGIQVEKIALNLDLLNAVKTVYDIISFSEASSNLSNLNGIIFGNRVEGKNWEDTFIKTRTNGFGKMVQRRLTLGSFFLEEKNQEDLFLRAQKVRRLIVEWFTEIHEKYDILIYPSTPNVAPLLSNLDDLENNFMKSILTASNLVGNPSLNFLLGKINDMPFNISVDSKIYEDEKLFSFSLFLEKMWKEAKNVI